MIHPLIAESSPPPNYFYFPLSSESKMEKQSPTCLRIFSASDHAWPYSFLTVLSFIFILIAPPCSPCFLTSLLFLQACDVSVQRAADQLSCRKYLVTKAILTIQSRHVLWPIQGALKYTGCNIHV